MVPCGEPYQAAVTGSSPGASQRRPASSKSRPRHIAHENYDAKGNRALRVPAAAMPGARRRNRAERRAAKGDEHIPVPYDRPAEPSAIGALLQGTQVASAWPAAHRRDLPVPTKLRALGRRRSRGDAHWRGAAANLATGSANCTDAGSSKQVEVPGRSLRRGGRISHIGAMPLRSTEGFFELSSCNRLARVRKPLPRSRRSSAVTNVSS